MASVAQSAMVLAVTWELGIVKAVLAGFGYQLSLGRLVGTPYPEKAKEEIESGLMFFDYVLTESDQELFIPSTSIAEIETILSTCSWQFQEWTRERNSVECLQGCHR